MQYSNSAQNSEPFAIEDLRVKHLPRVLIAVDLKNTWPQLLLLALSRYAPALCENIIGFTHINVSDRFQSCHEALQGPTSWDGEPAAATESDRNVKSFAVEPYVARAQI